MSDHDQDNQGQSDAAGKRLKSFIERIERLEEEKKGIADDIKDVYAESKSQGFDTTTMRRIIKLRAMDSQTRQEQEELLRAYASAVGIQGVLL